VISAVAIASSTATVVGAVSVGDLVEFDEPALADRPPDAVEQDGRIEVVQCKRWAQDNTIH
jgi:hypothetical protein